MQANKPTPSAPLPSPSNATPPALNNRFIIKKIPYCEIESYNATKSGAQTGAASTAASIGPDSGYNNQLNDLTKSFTDLVGKDGDNSNLPVFNEVYNGSNERRVNKFIVKKVGTEILYKSHLKADIDTSTCVTPTPDDDERSRPSEIDVFPMNTPDIKMFDDKIKYEVKQRSASRTLQPDDQPIIENKLLEFQEKQQQLEQQELNFQQQLNEANANSAIVSNQITRKNSKSKL